MSVPGDVRDAIARKVMNLPSAQHVYAVGLDDPDVAPYPGVLVDNQAHAKVSRGASTHVAATGNQILTLLTNVEWFIPGSDRAAAEAMLDTLEEEMVEEFSTGFKLDGIVISCVYAGADPPTELSDGDGVAWIGYTMHIESRIRYAIEMAP